MKFFILLILFICIGSTASAQTAGKITYQEKFDMHRNIPPERESMKDMIPQFNTMFFDLVFTENESVYQQQKEADESESTTNTGNTQVVMRFRRDNRVVYKNLAEDQMIDSRDFMQKQFLIKGPPTPRKWKIGTKQKEILGYNCLEASFQADSITHIRAWFTPQLLVSNGPSDYQGLPGMILQIDVNDGERVSTATQIILEGVDTSVIIAPDKGKEVTAAEFDKIREEKMKEMQIQNAAGPQMIITSRRN